MLTGVFNLTPQQTGAPDVRAAVERARGRAGDEAAACGVVQVGGDDAFGADDGSDE